MTGMEIYALLQIAKMGTDAIGSTGTGLRKRKEAKELEGSEDFKTATEAGSAALGRMTDPDGYAAGEAEVRKAGEERQRGAVKPVEQALIDAADGPSTTATTTRKDQLLSALSDIRQGSMTAGRGDVLSQKMAEESRDKDLFQVGQMFQDRLAQIKGEGRQATAQGVGTLTAGALVGAGKVGYDKYKANRDATGAGGYGLEDPMSFDDLGGLPLPGDGSLTYGSKR